jgi:FlaA1/EpsC-like NDP-sugar epimerase
MPRRIAELLRNLPNSWKICVSGGVDLLVLCLLVLIAYMLRVAEFGLPTPKYLHLYFTGPVLAVIFLGFFGIYGSSARGHSIRTEIPISTALAATVLLWAGYVAYWGSTGFSRSILIIFPVLAILFLVTLRRLASWFLSERYVAFASGDRKPVLIFGAGREGVSLAETLERQGRFKPVAFVDTDYIIRLLAEPCAGCQFTRWTNSTM